MSPCRIRSLIKKGVLRAINTAPSKSGKARYICLPEHVAEYERQMQVVPEPPPRPRRKPRKEMDEKDFYP
jgi:hypothetical protein